VFWFYARTGRVCPTFDFFFKQWLITITDEPLVADETLNVLRALLHSIPVFWGTGELSQVVKLYVDHCVPSSSMHSMAMSGLMKTIAKLAPAKVLLQTLCDIWPSVRTSPQGVCCLTIWNFT
jgi:U3 small nucleolar RNA-associated protein 10